ncbi:MAG: hypothetical protein CVU11_07055 [Bacteroidetes bacterium HGW-Bacteroidetes-6]|jgi:hypothetical protein|nr:MAG: hypothetical protein CVU11_07055 [Bacteroidetes bacterium HGW-Bacteroidetes-6]
MENNHILGLYVSYYLSRFDKIAYQNLGYGNQLETHKNIGKLLSVNPYTIKNWRDEFDPLFGHRVGWYQRPMNPSRIRVAQALENLDELQIRGIVEDILSGKINQEPDDVNQLILIASDDVKRKSTHKFILRAPTGKAAEEYFQHHYSENKIPVAGELIDCRDLGVGYDFRIENETNKHFVEVKGLSDTTGGIQFTNKEWTTAKEQGDKYFLCVVSNLSGEVVIDFIQNPAKKISPQKNLYTSIQISWSVTQKQLAEIK